MYIPPASTQPRVRLGSWPRWFDALLIWALVLTLLSAAIPRNVYAINAGDLTFTLVTPILAQDSNNSCGQGPKAIYIEVLVTNPAGGAGTLSNLSASLSAFAGAAGVTLDMDQAATPHL